MKVRSEKEKTIQMNRAHRPARGLSRPRREEPNASVLRAMLVLTKAFKDAKDEV